MPYTYLIGWSHINKYYYGCRYAKNCDPSDLWVAYFTSSKYVKQLRQEYGNPDVIQIRKTFNTTKECVQHESRVLKRIVYRDNFVNKNVAGAIIGGNTTPRTEKQKQSASQLMSDLSKGSWFTDGSNMKRLVGDPPAGWVKGYPEHYKDKISTKLSLHYQGLVWYNNGIQRRKIKDGDAPLGWHKGWKIPQIKNI